MIEASGCQPCAHYGTLYSMGCRTHLEIWRNSALDFKFSFSYRSLLSPFANGFETKCTTVPKVYLFLGKSLLFGSKVGSHATFEEPKNSLAAELFCYSGVTLCFKQ